MDHILAILDSEKSYVKKLAAFLESRTQIPFRILAFDNQKKLEKFFSDAPAAVLLVSEQDWDSSMQGLANQIIMLTNTQEEERLESNLESSQLPSVCKYQSGEAIAKKVLGICAVAQVPVLYIQPDQCTAKARAEIIGIYTPVGRSLQTSFALIYSSLRAKRKKTLYLNFEVFSGFSTWFEREYKTDLMDLMYFLDGPEDKFLLKLAGMTEQFGGFCYIPPAISYEDYMLVKAEEWMRLVETIALKSDLENQMQGLFEMLSICEKIYTISKPDGLAMAKMAAFEEALKMSQKEAVLQKIVKCRLPVFKEIPQRAESLTYSQLADYMKNKLGEEF
jgi:hypothetical protein